MTDLENLHTVFNGSIQVDVVRADTGGDTELEVLGLGEELFCKVARVEGGGDEDLGLVVILAGCGV